MNALSTLLRCAIGAMRCCYRFALAWNRIDDFDQAVAILDAACLPAGRRIIRCFSHASASWVSSCASIAHSRRACVLAIATSSLPNGRRHAN